MAEPPTTYEEWLKATGAWSPPAVTNPPEVVLPITPPRFVPSTVYVDVFGQPMDPTEFMADKRFWSGTTWADPYGDVNPFDVKGQLTPNAVNAGYTPEMLWENAAALSNPPSPTMYK